MRKTMPTAHAAAADVVAAVGETDYDWLLAAAIATGYVG
jgi:hypothetical protein